MASLVGGMFDPAENRNIDAEQSTLIRDFLDSLGLSESSVETVTVQASDSSSGGDSPAPFVLSDETTLATALAPDGKQISLSLNPDSETGKTLIIQGSGDALITGSGGGDNIQAGSGSDTVDAGLGDDLVQGGIGSDSLIGGIGNDIIYGNTGSDTLAADAGANSLFGGQGEDHISGGADGDFLMGNRDADIVHGNAGWDIVYGNQQNDTIFGGAGNDTLYGGQNEDMLDGGSGDDALHGNLGGDQFIFRSNSGVDVIHDFVAGTDTIVVSTGINGLQVTEPGDLSTRISSDALGNAVIDFGEGNVVTIDGLNAQDLLSDIGSYISIG